MLLEKRLCMLLTVLNSESDSIYDSWINISSPRLQCICESLWEHVCMYCVWFLVLLFLLEAPFKRRYSHSTKTVKFLPFYWFSWVVLFSWITNKKGTSPECCSKVLVQLIKLPVVCMAGMVTFYMYELLTVLCSFYIYMYVVSC